MHISFEHIPIVNSSLSCLLNNIPTDSPLIVGRPSLPSYTCIYVLFILEQIYMHVNAKHECMNCQTVAFVNACSIFYDYMRV